MGWTFFHLTGANEPSRTVWVSIHMPQALPAVLRVQYRLQRRAANSLLPAGQARAVFQQWRRFFDSPTARETSRCLNCFSDDVRQRDLKHELLEGEILNNRSEFSRAMIACIITEAEAVAGSMIFQPFNLKSGHISVPANSVAKPPCADTPKRRRMARRGHIRRYADTTVGGLGWLTPIRAYAGTPLADMPVRGKNTPIRPENTPIRRSRSKHADTPIQEANTPIRRSGQGGWHGVSVYR